jgi:hypothetical protein
MKPVTFELPDSIANVFESLKNRQKSNAALLAAFIAQTSPKYLESIFEEVDRKVLLSGLTSKEIDQLLDDIS